MTTQFSIPVRDPTASRSNTFPFPVTKEVVERGQQRFNVYCSPCHDRTGSGNGMVPQRGFRHPPSYHIDRVRKLANGFIFDAITNGFGAMPDYAAQIPPADRWAIVAYMRALQLSEDATLDDVPPAERAKLEARNDGAGDGFPGFPRAAPRISSSGAGARCGRAGGSAGQRGGFFRCAVPVLIARTCGLTCLCWGWVWVRWRGCCCNT